MSKGEKLIEEAIQVFDELVQKINAVATKENLKKIQNQMIDFGPYTNSISQSFSEHLLAYNDTWDKIDIMLDKIMSQEFRNRFQDSNGNGIIYNWHCLDNVGFITNERRRDIGFGNVFVHYQNKIKEHKVLKGLHDELKGKHDELQGVHEELKEEHGKIKLLTNESEEMKMEVIDTSNL